MTSNPNPERKQEREDDERRWGAAAAQSMENLESRAIGAEKRLRETQGEANQMERKLHRAEGKLAKARGELVRYETLGAVRAVAAPLQRELAEARETLRWYGNEDNYEFRGYADEGAAEVVCDNGARARSVLARLTTDKPVTNHDKDLDADH